MKGQDPTFVHILTFRCRTISRYPAHQPPPTFWQNFEKIRGRGQLIHSLNFPITKKKRSREDFLPPPQTKSSLINMKILLFWFFFVLFSSNFYKIMVCQQGSHPHFAPGGGAFFKNSLKNFQFRQLSFVQQVPCRGKHLGYYTWIHI